jgi:hypothetical protein
MNSILSYIENPELAPLLETVTEFTVTAIPKEIRDEDEERYFSVNIVRRSEGRYAVMYLNEAFDANLNESYESLPSSRTEEFIENFRFPLPEAVKLAEELASRLVFQGLSVRDIIKHGGMLKAHRAIPHNERPRIRMLPAEESVLRDQENNWDSEGGENA